MIYSRQDIDQKCITNIFRYEQIKNFCQMAVKEITDTKSWEIDVMSSPVPVFVDFWAEWCGPCRMVSPVVEELSGDYDGKVNFVKVNVDQVNELSSKYNVFSIPTLALFNKGKIVAQQVGAASKESYKNMIDTALEKI
ncbi:MAG: putative thioredoxin [Nitrosopumilales archaeon]|nr:MAG: putative thioredoxin [Nitrosopumilales archaeon]